MLGMPPDRFPEEHQPKSPGGRDSPPLATPVTPPCTGRARSSIIRRPSSRSLVRTSGRVHAVPHRVQPVLGDSHQLLELSHKDFNQANSPNHVTAGFPTTCDTCHTTLAWKGASFNHNNTPFPLTGAHTTVQCAQCHVGGKFVGLSTDCGSCHMKEFNGTSNPNHAAAGFPTTCSFCHTTTSWAGAVFDHSKTPFPLTGAHNTVQCAQCHVNGKFAGLPTNCGSCHLARFQVGHKSQPRRRGISDGLLALPHHRILGRRDIQSQRHAVPAYRRAHHGAMRAVPRERQFHECADGLRLLPPGAVQVDHQSEPYRRRIPDGLLGMSHHSILGGRGLRSQQDAVPTHRRAHHGAMRAMSRERQFRECADGLRFVPPGAVQVDHQSEPCRRRIPDGLLAMSHHSVLGGRGLRSQQDAVSAYRRAHHGAMRAMPRERQFHKCADGLRLLPPGAVQVDHQSDRTPPDSRSIARCATPPCPGLARRSITARLRSR